MSSPKKPNPATRDRIVQRALAYLAHEVRESDAIVSPQAARQYLQLRMADLKYEVFAVMFLDAQNRVIETVDLFRGTLTQTAVYPREVLIEALQHEAAAVVLAHNHPSGTATPSAADIRLTQSLKQALGLIDVRVLDHLVVTRTEVLSMAEKGLV